MGKAKPISSGFSSGEPAETTKQQDAKSSAEHATKEQQAIALINQGKLEDAEAIYEELISAGTTNHTIYSNLGVLLKRKGELQRAIDSYKTALKLEPNYPSAHYNLGNALKEQGNLDAAISSYNAALQIKPNHPDSHYNLGNALREKGDLDAAITSYNSALKLKSNYAEAHNNLGNALREKGNLDAAVASYNTALKLKSNHPEAHNNLGYCFMEQGDLDAAIASYNTALRLKPDFPEVYNNLGMTLQGQGNLVAAILAYNNAHKLNPDYPEAHWNSSLAMLLGGDYKNGWEKYEWRSKKQKDATKPHAAPRCPQWSSELTIQATEKLLLVSEQGLGDILQFMRYTTVLRNLGVPISLCAPSKLHTLIQTSGIDQSPLTSQEANEVTQGYWMPLLSVPRYLKVTPENPIITEPYIRTSNELINKWSGILGEEQCPIIGINWQGNPKTEKTGLQGRSLALEAFAPISGTGQASFLSLQKGFGSEQLENCSFKDRFVSCQDQINDTWDFLETAAIIANCDLIITSDTSVAHLAGGLGKTTWLLLHKVPDWRWGIEGDTTFWYPSMRLFRQKERGNWVELMARVAEAVQTHFPGNPTKTQSASADAAPATKPAPIQDILAPVSLGELVDKITILQIKRHHLRGTALENVKKELKALETTLNTLQLEINPSLIQSLKEVNQNLWQIEDQIRDQECQNTFGETFIRLARSAYKQNDRRAAIKKEINTTYGSGFAEEKSYQQC